MIIWLTTFRKTKILMFHWIYYGMNFFCFVLYFTRILFFCFIFISVDIIFGPTDLIWCLGYISTNFLFLLDFFFFVVGLVNRDKKQVGHLKMTIFFCSSSGEVFFFAWKQNNEIKIALCVRVFVKFKFFFRFFSRKFLWENSKKKISLLYLKQTNVLWWYMQRRHSI